VICIIYVYNIYIYIYDTVIWCKHLNLLIPLVTRSSYVSYIIHQGHPLWIQWHHFHWICLNSSLQNCYRFQKRTWGLLVPWSAADLGKGYIITLKRLGISLIHFSCLHGRCLISECSCCQHQLVSWARRRRRYSPLYQRAMELNKRDNFKMRCRPVNRERVVNIGEVFSVWVSQPPHAWLIAIE